MMNIIFFRYVSGRQSPKYWHKYQLTHNQFSGNGWEEIDDLPNDLGKSIELYYKELFGTSPFWQSSFRTNLYEINDFLDFHFEDFKNRHPEKINLFLNHTESITETFSGGREGQHVRGINKIKDMVLEWVNLKRNELNASQNINSTQISSEEDNSIIPANFHSQVIQALLPYLAGDKERIITQLEIAFSGEELETKLLFNGYSIQLAYFFKKLIKKGIITITQEKVIEWLMENFQYKNLKTGTWHFFSHSYLRNNMAKGAKPPRIPIPTDNIF